MLRGAAKITCEQKGKSYLKLQTVVSKKVSILDKS